MNKTVWVVGENIGSGGWQLLGIFDDEQMAFDACTGKDNFYGSVPLNVRLSDEAEEWPNIRFPNYEDGGKL